MATDESGAPRNRDSHRLPLMAKQVAGDDFALDLRSALVYPGGADLAVEMLEEMAPLQRDRSVNLDRGVDHLLRRLSGEEFRHRRAAGDRRGTAGVGVRGRKNEGPRGLRARGPPRPLFGGLPGIPSPAG